MAVFPAGSKQFVPPTWQELMTAGVSIPYFIYPSYSDPPCLSVHIPGVEINTSPLVRD